MKDNLKKQIADLLTGKKGKKDTIIFDTYNCEPGFYRYNGKVITLLEKEELEKDCKNSIIFTLAKEGIIDEQNKDENHLTIITDIPETGNILLKLRNIKKE